MREVFGYDIDGVLYDWHSVLYDHVVKEYGEKRSAEKFWKDAKNNNPPYTKMFWRNATENRAFLTKLMVDKEIVESVNRMAEVFDIYYITHRPKEVEFTTARWLKTNGFPFPENLIITSGDKAVPIKSVGCSYFIDDREHIVKSLKNVCNVIGVRKLWHEDKLEEQGFVFVDSAKELPTLLGI